jgi:hypothetical protein
MTTDEVYNSLLKGNKFRYYGLNGIECVAYVVDDKFGYSLYLKQKGFKDKKYYYTLDAIYNFVNSIKDYIIEEN